MSDLKSLGYISISTADIERWREFAFGVLGFAEGKGPDPSALYLRMDERAARIVVVPARPTEWSPSAGRSATAPRCSGSRLPLTGPECPSSNVRRRGRGAPGRGGDRVRGPRRRWAGGVLRGGAGSQPGDNPVRREIRHRHQGSAMSWCRPSTPTDCSKSTPTYWVSVPAARSGYRCRTNSARSECGSSASTNATTAWRSARAMHQRDPGVVHVIVEVDTLDAVGQALDRVNAEGIQVVLHAGAQHQRQDGVVLRPRARRSGTSSSARKACASTRPITPQRKSPRSLSGRRFGSGEPPAAMQP